MIGQKFGRWEVLAPAKTHYVTCKCECGKIKDVKKCHLLSGASKSCGCLVGKLAKARQTIHGLTHTPTYYTWTSMNRRCNCSKDHRYNDYGGRGIEVCDTWKESILNFVADMGYRPEGKQLDRIDNSGNYEPSNCQWVTPAENMNNRWNNHRLTLAGVSHTVAEWASLTGINGSTLSKRINRSGWSAERALSV